MDIALVLGLLLAAIVLFATEKLPVDVVTLLLLVALVLSGVLTTAEAFQGFSSDIIIVLASIFVITGALQESELLHAIGEALVKAGRFGARGVLLLIMGSSATLSAFMNNTTVAAMMVPAVMSLGRSTKTKISRLLMPMAFACIMGGTCTLIGTSTNIAVSGYIAKSGFPPLGFFEILPVGLVIVAVGCAYMLLIGERLLPKLNQENPVTAYKLPDYLSEIVVLPDSPLIGQTIAECDLARMDFRILGAVRGGTNISLRERSRMEANDTLLVEGPIEVLMKITKEGGLEIQGKLDLDELRLGDVVLKIVEVLVAPSSHLIGRTLSESGFSERFGLPVLAIHRHSQPLRKKIGDIAIALGDVLLVEGPAENVEKLSIIPGLVVLDEHRRSGAQIRKGIYAAVIFGMAVIAAGAGWTPLPIAFLAAALLLILLRCISIERARNAIDLRSLLLIGGMMAFGTAMEKTGAAMLLAQWSVAALSPFGPMVVLAGFLLLTIILTQPMSNAAAALVVLPVAMSAAQALELEPRTFAIGVMLAASISFITPLEPACILIYGPGRYRFKDFVKVGGGLTLILIPVVLLLIPVFWPLQAR